MLWQGEALNYSKRGLLALRQQVATVFQDPDQQIFYTDIDSDIAFSLRNLGVAEEEIARRVDEALTLVDARGVSPAADPVPQPWAEKNGWQSPGRWCCRRATCCLTSPPRASIHAGGRR